MQTLRPAEANSHDPSRTPETVLSMSGSAHIASVPSLIIAPSGSDGFHMRNGSTSSGVSVSSSAGGSAPSSPSSTDSHPSNPPSRPSSRPPSPSKGLHVDAVPPPPAATSASSDGADSLGSKIAASSVSPLPPLSTTRDRLLFVWRVLDAMAIYLRPLVFPLLAWMCGALHFNLLFPVALALIWYYGAKNGHLLPRPPPSAQQLQAALDKRTAEALLSPSDSPTDANAVDAANSGGDHAAPVSFQLDDRNITAGTGSASMLGLPAMLSGLTVKYPVWVFYPDVQRTKWINDILDQLWPYAKAAAKKEIDKITAPYLAKLRGYVVIAEMDFGPDAPFVGGIKTYDTKDADTVMLDIDVCLSIEPNIRIEARYKTFVFPVSVIAVTALITARATLTGLVGKFPCFRRLGVSLAGKPQIQTVVDVLGFNVFDVPIFGSWAQHLIEDVAMNLFGWPKELSIPIMVETAEEVAKRNRLEPKGLLHVFLMSANNLRNADVAILGKSDPYCKLTVGQQSQTSAVVHDNLNPSWSADFEFICYEPEKEALHVDVFDSDLVKVPNPLNTKRLGDVDFSIASLLQTPFQDVTLPLQHTTKGNIRFQVEWRPFKARSTHRHHRKDGEQGDMSSHHVLFVSSLRALDLPVDNAQLRLTLNNTKKKTELVPVHGRECAWEESFSFPVQNTEVDVITVQVRYDDHMSKLTGFATKTATLGMAKIKTKASTLSEFTIDMREVNRTGHLQDDFNVPLPPGMKSNGRPKLHMSLMLRELAAGRGHRERQLAATRAAIPGTLTVTLKRAANLVSDYGGKGKASDPYVIISVGTVKVKSAVQKRTTDPEWMETHTFRVSDLMRDDLNFDVRDWGHLDAVPGVGGMMSGFMHRVTMTNDHLGDAHVPLRMLYAQICDGAVVEKEVPLNHTKKGVLVIDLQFQPDQGVSMPPASLMSMGSMPDLLRIGSMGSASSLGSSSSSLGSGLLSRDSSTALLAEEKDDPQRGKTDSTLATPMVSAPLEHATIGLAAGMKTGEQLQRIQESNEPTAESTIATTNVASGTASPATSVPSTPPRSAFAHASADLTGASTPELSAPSSAMHSRQSSAGFIEADHIHHDPRTLEGFLVLTVHHALNLPAQHKDATISAYVKVTLGRTKVHTAVVTAVQPSWEAEVRLPLHSAEVVHPQSTILKVRVKRYKKGNIFGNEAVGDADVALSQLIDPKASNDGQFHVTNIRLDHGTLTLIDPKGNVPVGNVVLSCRFEPKPLMSPGGTHTVSMFGGDFRHVG